MATSKVRTPEQKAPYTDSSSNGDVENGNIKRLSPSRIPEVRRAKMLEMKANKQCLICYRFFESEGTRCMDCVERTKILKRARKRQGFCIVHTKEKSIAPNSHRCLGCVWASSASSLKRRFGLTIEDFARMEHAQNRLCKICSQPNKYKGDLHVDHCHQTGKIRGLLCNTCNVGIGMLATKDNLIKAIEYLEG